MKRFTFCILGLLCVFLSFNVAVYAAETTASIIGNVTDDNGAPLPGATVTAVNTATNFTRVATTEASGFYRVALLPPGTYTITIELASFAKQVHKDIVLTLGKEIALDVQLKLATAAEALEIVGETPLIDATKSQLAQTVDQTAIKSLPLNGRDYTQLALLAPGVKPVGTLVNYGQFTIGGQRGDAVNYTIDGGENNFSYTNEARTLFTQEGVKEFQILTNRFSAEYGRSTSGVINVISKSGTNELHGNGFFFFRADQLDSIDVFAQRNIDACEAGGGGNCDSFDPSFDQQQGGFTLGGPIVKDKTFFFGAYEQTNKDATLSVAITDSTPFGLRPKPVDLKLATAKLDHQFNTTNSMVFRYNFEDRSEAGFYAGGRYVDGVVQNITSQTAAVSDNAILSNNSYNEALFQYGRFLREDQVEAEGPALYRPSSVTGHHYCCPQRFLENRFELLDTFTHVFSGKGEHTVKMGGDYIHIDSQITFAQYFGGGYYGFTTDDPFNPNDPNTFPTYYFVGSGNPTNDDNNHQFSAFIQDDWRVNDSLTLNLGLRYDVEKFSGPTTGDPLISNVTGDTGIKLGEIPDVDKNNFAPRLGFTWDLGGKGSTVVRGGYGRYYKPILHNVYNNALLFNGSRYVILSSVDPNLFAQFCCDRLIDPVLLEASPTDVRPMQDAKVAFSDQASIGMQHEVANGYVINADYVYVKGNNLTREQNLNAPRNLVDPEPKPFPQFNRVRLLITTAGSDYHALQMSVQKRYTNNFLFSASYTLSKVEEDAADFFSVSEPNDQFNLDGERGPGTHDQRHVFAFSGVYDLPKQFQIGTIIRAASGIPVNFRINENHNHDGFGSNDRPDLGPNDTFGFPPPERPGNMPRNFGRADGFFQMDLRVAKNFDWGRYRLELIGEVFNLFNRTNFNFRPVTVNRTVTPEDVGKPVDGFATATEAFDPRQIQFGIKFDW